MDRLLRWRSELDARNADNVARTESYLELYAHTVENPPDLPWVLMAHLVSRNAGYLMGDVAAAIETGSSAFTRPALEQLFAFLERANWLIFHDAWWHVTTFLSGGARALDDRTTSFMRRSWSEYERAREVTAEVEQRLVMHLVENEQNYIERRVVHHARFAAARAIVGFVEAAGTEKPVVLPNTDAIVTVGGFASLGRRVAAGRRIFEEALSDRAMRRAAFEWAKRTPHTGCRTAHGGRRGPAVRDAWPASRVRALWPDLHAPPELDVAWP